MIAQHLINTSPSTAGVKKTLQDDTKGGAEDTIMKNHRLTSLGKYVVNDDKNIAYMCEGKSGHEKNDQGRKVQSIYDYGDAAPDFKAKQSFQDNNGDCTCSRTEKDGPLVLQPRPFSDETTKSDSLSSTSSSSDDHHHQDGTETPPRRSSLKQKDGSPRAARRASIQMGEEIIVRLPGRKELVRRRSFISFSSDVRVRPIVPVSKLSKNPERLWFQNDELTEIKQKSWKIVHDELVCQVLGRKSKYCTRGLERMLMQEEVKQNKHSSWDSVIVEQENQRNKGIFDDQCLARKYHRATANSQLLAQERAKVDEAEIQNYLRSTKRYVRRLSMS